MSPPQALHLSLTHVLQFIGHVLLFAGHILLYFRSHPSIYRFILNVSAFSTAERLMDASHKQVRTKGSCERPPQVSKHHPYAAARTGRFRGILTITMHPTRTSRPQKRSAPFQFSKRMLGVILVPLIFAGFSVCAGEEAKTDEQQRPPPVARQATSPNTTHVQQTAERGIDYLLSRADTIPPAWKFSLFGTLAKFTSSGAHLEAIRSVANQGQGEPGIALKTPLKENDLRWPGHLQKIMAELIRRQANDEPWQEPATQLQGLLVDHEDMLFAELAPTQAIVFLYQFDQLGIKTRRTSSDVAASLRDRWKVEDRSKLLQETAFMFGVTHVIYTASGYFDRALEPASFATEAEIFERAVALYADALPTNPFFLDVAGEVLASRKILGLPPTDATRALIKNLMDRQAADGSWGQKQFLHDVHATTVILHALLDFPKQFHTRR